MSFDQPLAVDCSSCVVRGTDACDDCLVTFLCERESDTAVLISFEEMRSLRMLSDAGLVPGLRHRAS
jgi:hypothetical protein